MSKTKHGSWGITDQLWQQVERLLPPRAPRASGKKFVRRPGGGRPPKSARVVFEAIVYVLRTGCQWKALPERFGSGSAIHKRFLEWERAGVFLAIWQAGLAEHEEMQGIPWRWQYDDGVLFKAAAAREASAANATERKKKIARRRPALAGSRAWRPALGHRNRRKSS